MGWTYALGILFGLRRNIYFRNLKDDSSSYIVEGREREMTDGLNVSNNSVENIISQGRFECFAYTKSKV